MAHTHCTSQAEELSQRLHRPARHHRSAAAWVLRQPLQQEHQQTQYMLGLVAVLEGAEQPRQQWAWPYMRVRVPALGLTALVVVLLVGWAHA